MGLLCSHWKYWTYVCYCPLLHLSYCCWRYLKRYTDSRAPQSHPLQSISHKLDTLRPMIHFVFHPFRFHSVTPLFKWCEHTTPNRHNSDEWYKCARKLSLTAPLAAIFTRIGEQNETFKWFALLTCCHINTHTQRLHSHSKQNNLFSFRLPTQVRIATRNRGNKRIAWFWVNCDSFPFFSSICMIKNSSMYFYSFNAVNVNIVDEDQKKAIQSYDPQAPVTRKGVLRSLRTGRPIEIREEDTVRIKIF